MFFPNANENKKLYDEKLVEWVNESETEEEAKWKCKGVSWMASFGLTGATNGMIRLLSFILWITRHVYEKKMVNKLASRPS
jgi:hypothetical protein